MHVIDVSVDIQTHCMLGHIRKANGRKSEALS